MQSRYWRTAAGLALAGAIMAAGCGLKGPLALPEKSERVIIRGPGETASPAGSPATGETTTTTTGGTTETPVVSPAPVEERPPPPPLPGGSNPGSARGG